MNLRDLDISPIGYVRGRAVWPIAGAADWPRAFGGDLSSGVQATETNLTLDGAQAYTNMVRKWHFVTGGNVRSGAAIVAGIVYIGSDDGKVYALNLTTGAAAWGAPFTIPGGTFAVRGTPCVSGGVVYIGASDGFFYALNAATGALIWKGPVVAGNPVACGGPVWSSAVVIGTTVVFGSDDGKLYALNVADGTNAASFPVNLGQGVIQGAIASFGGNRWVCAGSNLYRVSAGGVATLTLVTRNTIHTSPAMVVDPAGNAWVVVGSDDNYEYAVAASAILTADGRTLPIGTIVWTDRQSGTVLCTVAFNTQDGWTYMGTHNFNFEAHDFYDSKTRNIKSATNGAALQAGYAVVDMQGAGGGTKGRAVFGVYSGGDGRWVAFKGDSGAGGVPIAVKYPADNQQTIDLASWAGGVATLTTHNPHAMLVGQVIYVTGINPGGYNGLVTITAVGASTISYVLAGNPGAFVNGGTAGGFFFGSSPAFADGRCVLGSDGPNANGAVWCFGL